MDFNKGCGLNNLGNTCYLNSVLQCLYHIPKIKNFALKVTEQNSCKDTLLYKLGNLFSKMRSYSVLSPYEILNHNDHRLIKYQKGYQNDSTEFFLDLVEVLNEEFSNFSQEINFLSLLKVNTSLEISCNQCGYFGFADDYSPILTTHFIQKATIQGYVIKEAPAHSESYFQVELPSSYEMDTLIQILKEKLELGEFVLGIGDENQCFSLEFRNFNADNYIYVFESNPKATYYIFEILGWSEQDRIYYNYRSTLIEIRSKNENYLFKIAQKCQELGLPKLVQSIIFKAVGFTIDDIKIRLFVDDLSLINIVCIEDLGKISSNTTLGMSLQQKFNRKVSEEKQECFDCHKMTNFEVKMNIENYPEVLALNIKKPNKNTKNTSYFESFSLSSELCFDQITYHDAKYKLNAVSLHFGSSFSGHYTAYCLVSDGLWLHCNDSSVCEVPESVVLTSPNIVLAIYSKI